MSRCTEEGIYFYDEYGNEYFITWEEWDDENNWEVA